MNLFDTVEALESKDIAVAINLGVHQYCLIDSNCPIAIQLRKYINEADVTLPDLLEAYEKMRTATPAQLISEELPKFESKGYIVVAGKRIPLDLNQIVEGQLKALIEGKINELDRCKTRTLTIAHSFYNTYLHEIDRLRKSKVLPQLSYTEAEMLKTKCLITTWKDNSGMGYLFLIPVEYSPKSIIRDGIRYEIRAKDARAIKRNCYLEFKISSGNKFFEPRLLKATGEKLEHYHSSTRQECWGTVSLPDKWDGTLTQVARVCKSLMGSLATVNRNSILRADPLDMPSIDTLLTNSKELGREGQFDEPKEVSREEEDDEDERPGWGRARDGTHAWRATGVAPEDGGHR